jgi:hypothetical protein
VGRKRRGKEKKKTESRTEGKLGKGGKLFFFSSYLLVGIFALNYISY